MVIIIVQARAVSNRTPHKSRNVGTLGLEGVGDRGWLVQACAIPNRTPQ